MKEIEISKRHIKIKDLIKRGNKIVQEFSKTEILRLKETWMRENKEGQDIIHNKNLIKETNIAKEEVKATGDNQIRDNILKITIKIEIVTKINQRDMKKKEINMRISIMINET